ncbi:MAG: glucose-1-phosphate cytidylyltransferase [Candidatus Omnitrophica bacterium]|nr:glucose-1-phosphate cytidylyltransferase [Candidatus Omnitrophota bacterium]
MKVVILCGGRGTRLGSETESRPKPMVEIGGRPILWHIMKIYSSYGFNDFVLCLGYKGEGIKNYFLNYQGLNYDCILNLKSGAIRTLEHHLLEDWNVTLIDTGQDAQTGARVKKIERFIESDNFMLTYGDAVTNVDIGKLLEFHLRHKKIGTVTGVFPVARYQFGELFIKKNRVDIFHEKPIKVRKNALINGGFFVFNRKFFKLLKEDDNCILEQEPLERLAKTGQLNVYKHDGFWQCMDVARDAELLNRLWRGKAPWKIWKD